jgi:hypothetical protein
MKTTILLFVGMVLALVLVACGGSVGEAQTFTEPCVGGVAKHDFRTTDPNVLVRVSALDTKSPASIGIRPADPNQTSEAAVVHFDGSVAVTSCAGDVIFALDP